MKPAHLTLLVWMTVAVAPPVLAADATIIGIYENCSAVTSTIVVRPGAISAPQANRAIAEAEAIAASTANFEQALPEMVSALERHGIAETEVTRRGYEDCEPPSSGNFVEAFGTYCDGTLTAAEIRVDGKLFLRRTNPGVTLETFVEQASAQLRDKGVRDRPRVSVGNDANCAEPPQQDETPQQS